MTKKFNKKGDSNGTDNKENEYIHYKNKKEQNKKFKFKLNTAKLIINFVLDDL